MKYIWALCCDFFLDYSSNVWSFFLLQQFTLQVYILEFGKEEEDD